MKNLRALILFLSLCMTTANQAHVTVVVEERRTSFWDWPFWDTPCRTYTVCNSCCHSRCTCYDYQFLTSTEGIIATLIISAIALAVRLIQDSDHKERRPHRTERTTEIVRIRSY